MAWYRSRYVQFLEAEVARLQERERLLLNRVMPRLGYEPLDLTEKKPAAAPKRRGLSMQQWAVHKMREAGLVKTELVGLSRPDRKEPNGDTAKPA